MTAAFDPAPAARFLADVWHGSKQITELPPGDQAGEHRPGV
jgi:hypothetical protein